MKAILEGIVALALWAAGLAVIGVLALFTLAHFGSTETRYRCAGTIEQSAVASGHSAAVAYVKMRLYRPFIFWADSAGMVWIETRPDNDLLLFQDVGRIGDLTITMTSAGKEYASISDVGRILRANLGGGRSFVGECTPMD